MALRFDDKVVVITGAGGGLGRSHALMFGARGAKVVVNDLGGTFTGEGADQKAADKVASEIKALGGEAVANYDSVEDGAKIIQTAMDAYGRVDVVVNNAGILRDVSFHKMTDDDWDMVYKVHVKGAYAVTKAAWPIMREQGYGRVIMTASAAGIYGNFGQANYSMAKLGLYGFANTLAVEGMKKGIQVNTIAPVAGSRMTETVFPPELLDALKPEYVSPLVAWLAHEHCKENGGLFEVGGGYVGKLRWERTAGKMWRIGREISPENVRDQWETICAFDDLSSHPDEVMQSFTPIMTNVNAGASKGGNEFIDVDEALGYEFPEMTSSYDERDLALYALGVGASADPLDDKELKYVYELHNDGFTPLPSYGVIPAINTVLTLAKEGHTAPGANYGIDRLLHGEQKTELLRPLPPNATLTHKSTITDIIDKGKNALVKTETISYDEDGEPLIKNWFTAVIRGAGGWGGEKVATEEKNTPPERKPDAVVEQKIGDNQALLYRLSGDWNPLHADPGMAMAFGFEKPILHGLCTYGYAARHVLNTFCDDPRLFKSIDVRFADSVFPGETLITEMWKEGDQKIIFRCRVKERDSEVLSRAAIEFYDEVPKKKEKPKAASASSSTSAPAVPNSADIFAAIGDHLAANVGLADKVKTVYQFKLKDPASVWTLDLKSATPSVSPGETQKPECTLELTDADFMDMCTGKADPQQLYFGGQLQIGGNIMASQKLEFLKKIDPANVEAAMQKRLAAGGGDGDGDGDSGAPSAEKSGPSSAAVMGAIGAYIADHQELIDKVKNVYLFTLKDPDSVWTLDLKNAPGGVVAGEGEKADCTLTLADSDFMDMVSGKADPQQLYFGGQLKIGGNLMASQKLEFLTKIDKSEIAKAMDAGATDSGAPPAAAPSNGANGSSSTGDSKAEAIFAALMKRLDENKNLVPEVDAVIHFRIKGPDRAWLVDMKDNGSVVESHEATNHDATITIEEPDFLQLISGTESAQALYQQGKLRVDGDVRVAQRLSFLNNLV